MGYPRAVSNAETNTTSVHTPNLPIQHGTLISPSHPRSPFTLVTFLFTFRSSTYLLNNSPAPNLIAVRDTCNEIHQFISSDPTIFFFFIPKHHFFFPLTFRIIRYRVRTICYFHTNLQIRYPERFTPWVQWTPTMSSETKEKKTNLQFVYAR